MIKNKELNKEQELKEMFTYVYIKENVLENLSQEIKNKYDLEDYCDISLAYARELIDEKIISYDDISLDGWDNFDENEYKDYIHELVKDAEHYLVYLPNSTWNNASGCGIVSSLEDAFYRDYDCSQYIKGVSKGNKAVLLQEYHHDKPMGHHVIIIALTDKEYNKLKYTDFTTLEDFALQYMYLETNKRELLKTIVNL